MRALLASMSEMGIPKYLQGLQPFTAVKGNCTHFLPMRKGASMIKRWYFQPVVSMVQVQVKQLRVGAI